ncbi:MAG: 1,4-alpha-glucan branching protein GlgB [Pirellulaceae bacterium]|nr:1,4-alpha-glucan branching protein GlgB [Pirellulaceae bacterium]
MVLPLFTEFDCHLFGKGEHWDLYHKMGAHLRRVEGEPGVHFSLWAPNAKEVTLVADFNYWQGSDHHLKPIGDSGLWEIYVEGIGVGQRYKYQIKTAEDKIVEKSDPYGFSAEIPPKTASVVTDLATYQWNDDHWMAQRCEGNSYEKPLNIYEVHLGSWQQDRSRENGWLNYRDLAHRLVDYCHEVGYTHLELLPVSEHPYTGSWGYQTVGYYSATSRYGRPQDLMYFIDHCHQNGVGVLLDWVPAHFPKDLHGLANFDGTSLYEHDDPRQGDHPDWGTKIFNYGRCEVQNFLIANALFWFDQYHVDGLRVDAVASMLYLDYSREEGEWLPNKHGGRENLEAIDFLKKFNEQVHRHHKGVLTIAEESTSWEGVTSPVDQGGLGFDYKWNMGWMNDTLRYMGREAVHRRYHHNELTFGQMYAYREKYILPLSHDEVVHGKRSLLGKMSGDWWQQRANWRLLLTFWATQPGKKLLFQGGDFGQVTEWDNDISLPWYLLETEDHHQLHTFSKDLCKLILNEESFYINDHNPEGFSWIDCENADEGILSYLRYGKSQAEVVVVFCNFTPEVRKGVIVGVPQGGLYAEILNTDSSFYGGTNVGNCGEVSASSVGANGYGYSLTLTLPPLGAILLKPRNEGPLEEKVLYT